MLIPIYQKLYIPDCLPPHTTYITTFLKMNKNVIRAC